MRKLPADAGSFFYIIGYDLHLESHGASYIFGVCSDSLTPFIVLPLPGSVFLHKLFRALFRGVRFSTNAQK